MFDSLRGHLKVSYYRIRKSLYISDFVTLMRPYVTFISILGFFPYDTNLSSYKLAKMSSILSMVAITSVTLSGPIIISKMNFVERSWKESYVTLHWIGLLVFGVVGLWASFASSRSKLHLLRMVSTATRVLSPAEFCDAAKWMFTIDIVKACLYFSYISDFRGNSWSILYSGVSLYTFLVPMLIATLYANCLYVLNLCFRKINTSLEKLKTSLATGESHLLRRVYHSQKNPALLSELKTLRKLHLEFSRLVDAISETFGLEIIVIITFSIMDITFNLYFYLLHNTVDGKIVHVWSINIVYLAYNSLQFIVLAGYAEMVRDQVKNIGNNIHRILVVTFDQQISTELELFSMQVLQQNHTNTAKGLVIDLTLLTKMVGIITTYLLILIQFLVMKTC